MKQLQCKTNYKFLWSLRAFFPFKLLLFCPFHLYLPNELNVIKFFNACSNKKEIVNNLT